MGWFLNFLKIHQKKNKKTKNQNFKTKIFGLKKKLLFSKKKLFEIWYLKLKKKYFFKLFLFVKIKKKKISNKNFFLDFRINFFRHLRKIEKRTFIDWFDCSNSRLFSMQNFLKKWTKTFKNYKKKKISLKKKVLKMQWNPTKKKIIFQKIEKLLTIFKKATDNVKNWKLKTR